MEKKEDEIFCSHCGKIIKKEAEICVGCGIRQYKSVGKDKTVAILLAVFLGFWTWLYTYKVDAWKFWLNLGLSIVTLGFYSIAAWIWAIIDTATRPDDFYNKF